MAEVRLNRLIKYRGIAGILLLVAALLLALAQISYDPFDLGLYQEPPNNPPHNFIGPFGAWSAMVIFHVWGVAAWIMPVAILGFGILCLSMYPGRVLPKAGWILATLVLLTVFASLMPGTLEGPVRHLNIGHPGGILGHLLGSHLFARFLGTVGASILAAALLFISLISLLGFAPADPFIHLKNFLSRAWQWLRLHLKRGPPLGEEEEQALLALSRKEMKEKNRRAAQLAAEGEPRLSVDFAQDDGKPVAVATLLSEEEPPPRPAAPAPRRRIPEPEDDSPFLEEEIPAPKIRSTARPPVHVPERKIEPPPPPKPEPKFEPPPRPAPKPAPPPVEPVPPPMPGQYTLPPMSLLDHIPEGASRGELDIQYTAQVLQATLKEFDVDAAVMHAERGPRVTSFEVRPAPGVRVERITSLSRNLALALKAESLRVQAPIPGKDAVGIEIPNTKGAVVFFRELLESEEFKRSKAALPLCLGVDVGGRKLILDLASMPHLLIAGATGSGKSVCMNSLLAGLLMSRTPDQLRLILVDPKIVEMTVYNDLPHLVVPVVNDAKKVGLALRWAIEEMEKRYKLFAKAGVRDIKQYNARAEAVKVEQPDLFDSAAPAAPADSAPAKLPYVVIVIDELADLMMVAQAEVENYIARLTQKARAAGLHMIIATQRPSVDVITGVIKANVPGRIAFQVASKVDSRTILDTNGADDLLGKGDMLLLPPGTSKIVRAQGAMCTDEEIRRIVDFIKAQGTPAYEMSIKDKLESPVTELPEDEEEDGELIAQAVEVIRQTRRASTSSLQRRLKIGYNRAARLMDQLEQQGIVGPPQGSDPREILIDLDGEIPQNDTNFDEPQPST